jgi:diguanylate cyclase (GGDEF)-like protein
MVRATAMRDAEGRIIGAVESFSNNSSVVNARMKLRELRQVAATDPLTGIGNRSHLEGRFSAIIAEYQNNRSRAGVLFIDVDHFKQVNDAHGHNCGDSVLRMVSSTIRYAVRATDTVGRWGGEEFIAILYDMKQKNALRSAAEKVRVLVEHSRLDLNGLGVKVTISIGGTLLGAKDTPETLIQRADDLLYQSKQAGRNRVTIG